MSEHSIRVRTASAGYVVHVGRGNLETVGARTRSACAGGVAAIVTDSNVGPLYASRVRGSLERAGFRVTEFSFAAGEASKRIGTYARCLEALAAAGLTRDDVVVALGGGVVGDLGGFAAATYMRGCSVVQVPTSLLAMVDSSVGGKTAVDLEAGKNLAGAFFQPSSVIADVDCLGTISPELLRDSCGEVIKHGVLADEVLFSELERMPLNATGRSAEDVARVVARNVEIKRDVVDADERERGVRQTLNLGHTIGHAIEAASDFSMGHGTCVAIGLCCIARAAVAEGMLEAGVARRIERCVAAHGLPIDTDLPHNVICDAARADKKRHGDHVNVVMPRRIGRVEVVRYDLAGFARLVDEGCGTSEEN